MSDDAREDLIRRILIALDSSPNSLAALHIAADIAAHLDAEIHGLYVEDINLLRSASYPFAREVSFYSATVTQIDQQQVELQLRAQANRARRTLDELCRRRRLRSHFRVERGSVGSEVLRAARDTDLLVLGRTGWSRRRRLGSTARLMIAQSPRHTLVLSEGAGMGSPVAVVFDGSEAGYRSLAIADYFLKDIEGALSVWIVAHNYHQAREFQEQVDEWLKDHERDATFRWLLGSEARRLGETARRERIGTLIIPTPAEEMEIESLIQLMDEIDTPILLVR